MEAHVPAEGNLFPRADARYHGLKDHLLSREMLTVPHSEVEQWLAVEGRELLRELMQSHLDARGPGDVGRSVTGADGVKRTHRRPHERELAMVFGVVLVTRLGYRSLETSSLHPMDVSLNLPMELYSHGIRRLVAEEVAKVSYSEVGATVERITGVRVPHRQLEELAIRAAYDFDAFYAERQAAARVKLREAGAIVVVTADAKGVVMRQEDLREATRKKAQQRTHKMGTRLSPGEKRNAKRMAEVAAVYTIDPFVRTPEEVLEHDRKDYAAARPKPQDKRVWASLGKEPEEVLEEAFREANARDPRHAHRWAGLVDGNRDQINILERLAMSAGVTLILVLDVIHVIEYLWKAVTAFERQGTPEAEAWVRERLLRILHGHASDVAAGIRRSATLRGLTAGARKAADQCSDYLLGHVEYLHYDQYLAAGLPISTGVIEGACRYLVKDRMDITGARWTLDGAEAVLRLRALKASGDFEAYWAFHLTQEQRRNHLDRYADGKPPVPPLPIYRSSRASTRAPHLRLVA